MSYHNLSALLEAIIYLAKDPVTVDSIRKALPDVDRKEIDECIASLIEKYREPQHGIEIREVADGRPQSPELCVARAGQRPFMRAVSDAPSDASGIPPGRRRRQGRASPRSDDR